MIGNRLQALTYLMELPADAKVEIKLYKEKRTLTQNSYFHALVGQIARVIGSSITEVKNQLVADFGVFSDHPPLWIRSDVEWTKLEEIHLRPSPNYDVIDGELSQLFHIMKSTTKMTTAEFSHLVDGCIEEAKGLGIETLPPHELEAMRRREADAEARLQKRSAG